MEKFKYIGMYFLKRFGMILIIFFLAAFINYYLLQQLPGDKVLAFVGDVAYGQMTDAEKLAKLVEDVEFDNKETFEMKVKISQPKVIKSMGEEG